MITNLIHMINFRDEVLESALRHKGDKAEVQELAKQPHIEGTKTTSTHELDLPAHLISYLLYAAGEGHCPPFGRQCKTMVHLSTSQLFI